MSLPRASTQADWGGEPGSGVWLDNLRHGFRRTSRLAAERVDSASQNRSFFRSWSTPRVICEPPNLIHLRDAEQENIGR
jgi:hypothetical protein